MPEFQSRSKENQGDSHRSKEDKSPKLSIEEREQQAAIQNSFLGYQVENPPSSVPMQFMPQEALEEEEPALQKKPSESTTQDTANVEINPTVVPSSRQIRTAQLREQEEDIRQNKPKGMNSLTYLKLSNPAESSKMVAQAKFSSYKKSQVKQLKRNKQATHQFNSKVNQFERALVQRKIDYGSEDYNTLVTQYFPGYAAQQDATTNAAPPVQKKEEETIPTQDKAVGGKQLSFAKASDNKTGMPDNLKAGIENLSGIDMSNVRVHSNSSKPKEVGAHAYTKGNDIHLAPGQEKHLPHEAWHAVQQQQGRVQPTEQLKGENINSDEGLEKEADVMGEKLSSNRNNPVQFYKDELITSSHTSSIVQRIIQITDISTSITANITLQELKNALDTNGLNGTTIIDEIRQKVGANQNVVDPIINEVMGSLNKIIKKDGDGIIISDENRNKLKRILRTITGKLFISPTFDNTALTYGEQSGNFTLNDNNIKTIKAINFAKSKLGDTEGERFKGYLKHFNLFGKKGRAKVKNAEIGEFATTIANEVKTTIKDEAKKLDDKIEEFKEETDYNFTLKNWNPDYYKYIENYLDDEIVQSWQFFKEYKPKMELMITNIKALRGNRRIKLHNDFKDTRQNILNRCIQATIGKKGRINPTRTTPSLHEHTNVFNENVIYYKASDNPLTIYVLGTVDYHLDSGMNGRQKNRAEAIEDKYIETSNMVEGIKKDNDWVVLTKYIDEYIDQKKL